MRQNTALAIFQFLFFLPSSGSEAGSSVGFPEVVFGPLAKVGCRLPLRLREGHLVASLPSVGRAVDPRPPEVAGPEVREAELGPVDVDRTSEKSSVRVFLKVPSQLAS